MSKQHSTEMSKAAWQDFCELAEDMVLALVLNPNKVEVSISEPDSEDNILVACFGPRAEIAMLVGKHAETARSLHRVLSCIARNWGHEGTVKVAWEPTDAQD